MFNSNLQQAVHDFANLILPLSEKDLERYWKWKDHDKEGIRFSIFVTIQELHQLAVQLTALRTPPTPAQQILSQYHAGYMDLQAALFGLSDEEAERIPTEGEWPVRRVYAHILGADIGFSATVRYALEHHRAGTWTPENMSDEDEIRLVGMTEEQYNTMMEGPLAGMLAYHQNFHPAMLQDFSAITNTELDLPSTFWEETRFPIRHRLHRYEAHIIQHTVQIDKTLAAIGAAPGETKRLIRHLFSALAGVEENFIGNDNGHEMCEALASGLKSRMAEVKQALS